MYFKFKISALKMKDGSPWFSTHLGMNRTSIEWNIRPVKFEHWAGDVTLNYPAELFLIWRLDCPPKYEEHIDCHRFLKYRSFEGSCNNLKYPSWGNRTQPYSRITARTYADGQYGFRVTFPEFFTQTLAFCRERCSTTVLCCTGEWREMSFTKSSTSQCGYEPK